jgi:hypothetical protein
VRFQRLNWNSATKRLWVVYAALSAAAFLVMSWMNSDNCYPHDCGASKRVATTVSLLMEGAIEFAVWIAWPVAVSHAAQWVWRGLKTPPV